MRVDTAAGVKRLEEVRDPEMARVEARWVEVAVVVAVGLEAARFEWRSCVLREAIVEQQWCFQLESLFPVTFNGLYS